MMLASIAVLCLAATHHTYAFPSRLFEDILQARNADQPVAQLAAPHVKRQAPGITPPFDAAEQYVSNTGEHAFVAPSGTDQRGPCPGLNAMANHGYLPHNGIGSMEDFINGTAAVFGMGADLSTFLAIYGAVVDGDLTSYSIGGPVSTLTTLGGLLGEPQGLSGSHNKYENDVSPTRGDLYEYGNDYLVQLSQFTALYELGQQNGNSIDLDVLTDYRVTRFNESINNNPYFFNAPFSGVIASAAAWSFIYRFMANKSAENPEGLLTGDVLQSFYSVTGDYPDFTYTPGHEAIPDNWYKRNPVDYYTIPYLSIDSNTMALAHPQFLSVGGNTGTVNSFTGIDPENLTGGVFTTSNLLEGNNAACYGFELGLQEAPDILQSLYSDVTSALDTLSSAFQSVTSELGCPTLSSVDMAQFSQFPGYTDLSSDGTY